MALKLKYGYRLYLKYLDLSMIIAIILNISVGRIAEESRTLKVGW